MRYKQLVVTAMLCSTCAFTQDKQPPKPAEEVYKNIQVMKGVPAPRLMGAMQFFTKSLGVECSYCHVPNEFDKDDKAPKDGKTPPAKGEKPTKDEKAAARVA